MVIRSNLDHVCFCILKVFLKIFKFYFILSLLQINIFLMFSDHFNALISKIIFKKLKYIYYFDILFLMKNTLKKNHNHTLKYSLKYRSNPKDSGSSCKINEWIYKSMNLVS
jgi:hypothetical protein